ncbi:MAG: hypothetical protein EZS28_005447 [Streblomastix strix]|uniref:Uncharacterized protein n=1 Tax=Streblomastix strix TaxID=222440 RepID=A0A5J4WVQ7_9EUKA|nr:MAG: hypothetical protein EZS28_005447 [Streblomastix strix]
MRLTSFYESQKLKKITEQNNNAIHIDTGWGFRSRTSEQHDEFKEDFVNDSQYLEIRPLDKNNKKHKHRKHQRSVGQPPWTTVQLDELSGTAKEGSRPVKQKIEIEITHLQKAKDSPSNINKPTKKVASSTDGIASGQVGVAGTKPINIQTALSTQLEGNPNREPKIENKGGRTPVRGKATSTNTSVVANQNQSEDQQR